VLFRSQSHNTLPELNLDHPDVLGFLIRNEDSVVRHWLRRGATGWRLDCANDLGPTLCSEIAQVVASEGGSDGAIGEVMAYAEEFVQAGGLHGVMNYYFRATVLALIGGEISASQAAANFKRMARRYHYPALLRSWNILASHDTPRLASELESPESRKLAFALACAFPGVPMIYYGEEVGMHGGPDPINRAPMVWRENEWDHEILEFVRHLINLRRQSPALLTGGYESLPQPAHPDVLAFARTGEHPQDTVIVLANVSDRRAEGRFFIPLSSMFDSLPLHDLLHEGRRTHMESGAMRTELAPYDVAFFSPVDVKKPRYSFFSGYKANGTAQ
jgi:glycosidase